MKIEQLNERLFNKLTGKRIRKVLKELGFPEVPVTALSEEDILIFQQHIDKLPTSPQEASAQLIRSIHRGKVTEIRTLKDGRTLLNVSFKHIGYECVIQLVHMREHWETVGTPSIKQTQTIAAISGAGATNSDEETAGQDDSSGEEAASSEGESTSEKSTSGGSTASPEDEITAAAAEVAAASDNKKPRLGSMIAAGSVAAILLAGGGAWVGSSFGSGAMSTDEAVKRVEEDGYVVLTQQQKNDLVKTAEEKGFAEAQEELSGQKDGKPVAKDDKKNNVKDTKDKKDKKSDKDGKKDAKKENLAKEKGKKLVFEMKSGMTTEDITAFLKKKGLIKDRYAFGKKIEKEGIAESIDIGKYEFMTGMSEREIMKVLEGETSSDDQDEKKDSRKDTGKKDKKDKRDQKAKKDKKAGEKVVFTLAAGMTSEDLCKFLEEEGLVKDWFAFSKVLQKAEIDQRLDNGDYVFKRGMSEQQLLNVLEKNAR